MLACLASTSVRTSRVRVSLNATSPQREAKNDSTLPAGRQMFRHIAQDEADNLTFRNEAKWRCSRYFRSSQRGRCTSGNEHLLEMHMTVPLRDDGTSPAALTARESEANADLRDDAKVSAAREKVQAWPEVYDDKAFCISWLRCPRDGVTEVGRT